MTKGSYEGQPDFSRGDRALSHRGPWVRRLWLFPHAPCRARVLDPVSALDRSADLGGPGQSFQALLRGRLAADRLLRPENRQSRVCPLEIHRPEALVRRRKAERVGRGPGPDRPSLPPRRALGAALRPALDLGRGDHAGAGGLGPVHLCCPALLLAELRRLGPGGGYGLGAQDGKPAGFHPLPVYLPGLALGPFLSAREPGGFSSQLSGQEGDGRAGFLGMEMAGRLGSFPVPFSSAGIGAAPLRGRSAQAGGQAVSASLQEKFSVLIGWEKLKRRETLLISALCYSLLFSLMASPAAALLPPWADPLIVPAAIFLVLAPGLFFLRPWRTGDSLRAVWLLDRTLGMEERAITAWEILDRGKKGSAELLVLEEAEGRLKGVDPKAIFKRRLTWQAISAPLFFLLWLLFVFLDDGVRLERISKASQASSAAARLREFSRELRDRAASQGLSESLETARALEGVAAERLAGEVDEKGLQENLAGLADGLRGKEAAGAGPSDLSFAMATAEGLLDLKAEMEALRTALLPDSAKGQEGLGREALERLGSLPRLKEEIGKRLPSFEK